MKQRAFFFAMAFALCGGAQAQSDESAKTIRDLQERVKALEQQKQGAPAETAGGARVIAPEATAEEGAQDANKARVELSGQIMLDAIYDFKRVDPDWNATLRPSKIPVNCPASGDPGCGKNGETVMSVRQSSLGVKGFIPTTMGELKTELAFDLFNTGGGSTEAHWLNVWGELGIFGAGQYYSNFMDIDTFPNTIDYWGPSGMVFLRNPQLRVTPINHDGMKVAFSLEAPSSALDTGKVSEVDPSLNISSRNRYPDFVASLRLDRDWGHVQAAGILREVGYDTPNQPGSEPSGQKTGYGLNLSGVYNTIGKDRVVGQVAVGEAIASYMNDGGVDLAPDASLQAETVKSVGWFVYYDRSWNDKWSSSIGYSEHRQTNTGGQLNDAFKKGSYASVNLLYYPVKNVTTGAELLWGQLEQKDGATGEDNRIQFSAKYKF